MSIGEFLSQIAQWAIFGIAIILFNSAFLIFVMPYILRRAKHVPPSIYTKSDLRFLLEVSKKLER